MIGTMFIQEVIHLHARPIMDKIIGLFVEARGAPRNSLCEVLSVVGQILNSHTAA